MIDIVEGGGIVEVTELVNDNVVTNKILTVQPEQNANNLEVISEDKFVEVSTEGGQGPPGPEGPEGPQGPQGPQGPPGPNVVDFVDFTPQTSEPSFNEGRAYYDDLVKALTLMTDITAVRHNLGQELFVPRVINNTGVTIPNGSVVYPSGVSGGKFEISLARSDDAATSNVLGLVTHDIANGADGWVTHVGDVNDVDTSSFNVGDTLYLSSSVAGGWTTTAPQNKIPIGTVKVSDASNGKIELHVARKVEDQLPVDFVLNGRLNYVSASSITIGISGRPSAVRDSTDTYNIKWIGTITLDITMIGPNGLDTGSESASTWYAVHCIADSREVNPVAGLLSLSSTSPTLPAGYNKFRRLGWARNNSSSNIINFEMSGANNLKYITYQDSIANRSVLAGGAAVGFTTISLAAFVPPTSNRVSIQARESGTADLFLARSGATPLYGFVAAGIDSVLTSYPCTNTQTMQYAHLAGGGSTSIWLAGYFDELT